jgi:hypothetical protein
VPLESIVGLAAEQNLFRMFGASEVPPSARLFETSQSPETDLSAKIFQTIYHKYSTQTRWLFCWINPGFICWFYFDIQEFREAKKRLSDLGKPRLLLITDNKR